MLFKIVLVGHFGALECRRIHFTSTWRPSGNPRGGPKQLQDGSRRPKSAPLGPKDPKYPPRHTPKSPQDGPRSPRLPCWDRFGAVLGCFGTVLGLLMLMFWGPISRAAAVFYTTAAAWTELEMLPKGVQLCFGLLSMIYFFRS